jgi:hypothetical protein
MCEYSGLCFGRSILYAEAPHCHLSAFGTRFGMPERSPTPVHSHSYCDRSHRTSSHVEHCSFKLLSFNIRIGHDFRRYLFPFPETRDELRELSTTGFSPRDDVILPDSLLPGFLPNISTLHTQDEDVLRLLPGRPISSLVLYGHPPRLFDCLLFSNGPLRALTVAVVPDVDGTSTLLTLPEFVRNLEVFTLIIVYSEHNSTAVSKQF